MPSKKHIVVKNYPTTRLYTDGTTLHPIARVGGWLNGGQLAGVRVMLLSAGT